MVTTIVLAALVVALGYVRHYRKLSKLYRELYQNENEDRIDYELELHRTQVQLEDSRQAYGRLIGTKCQGWASATVTMH